MDHLHLPKIEGLHLQGLLPPKKSSHLENESSVCLLEQFETLNKHQNHGQVNSLCASEYSSEMAQSLD